MNVEIEFYITDDTVKDADSHNQNFTVNYSVINLLLHQWFRLYNDTYSSGVSIYSLYCQGYATLIIPCFNLHFYYFSATENCIDIFLYWHHLRACVRARVCVSLFPVKAKIACILTI